MISCFDVRCPSIKEFEDEDIPKLDIMYESLEWDHAGPDWAEQEASTINVRGQVHDTENVIAMGRQFINLVSTSEQGVEFTSDGQFHDSIRAHVKVSQVKVTNGHHTINYKLLAEKWLVLIDFAKRTLEQTTQQGVRAISHPSLACRFRTNDRQLQHEYLQHDMFTDMIQAKTRSCRGELYAQVYTTGFHWSWAHPMKKKSIAHNMLALVFQCDGVPPQNDHE